MHLSISGRRASNACCHIRCWEPRKGSKLQTQPGGQMRDADRQPIATLYLVSCRESRDLDLQRLLFWKACGSRIGEAIELLLQMANIPEARIHQTTLVQHCRLSILVPNQCSSKLTRWRWYVKTFQVCGICAAACIRSQAQRGSPFVHYSSHTVRRSP